MQAGRTIRALAVIVTSLASACTVLFGPSNDELTGGTPSSSASSTSGTLPDGALAASSSTSSSSSTSASSSSGGGGDGGRFTCPPDALLCTDFESEASNPFPTKEGRTSFVEGGHDSPTSLEAALQASEPSPSVSVTSRPDKKGGTLSFWFRPDGAPPSDSISFRIAHALWGAGCDWELSWTVYLTKAGIFISTDSYNASVNPSCGPIAFGSKPLLPAAKLYDGNWHRVTVTMDASQSVRTTRTTIDSEVAVDMTADSDRTTLPASVDIALGVPCIQEGGGCFGWDGPTYRVRFDDVSFTPAK